MHTATSIPMRIAVVVHKFPPSSYGGTEVYSHALAKSLSREHEVAVFYRNNGSIEEIVSRGKLTTWAVPSLPKKRSLFLSFISTFYDRRVELSFKRFIDEFKPDIIHFQHLMSLSYRLPFICRSIPCVLTLHDYWFLCANAQMLQPHASICKGKAFGMNCARCAVARSGYSALHFASPAIAALMQVRDALVRKAASEIGNFVSPSFFLKSVYVEHGFQSDSFTVLENGIDLSPLSAHSWRPSYDGRLRVTYVGAIAWQKGVHVLLESVRGLDPKRVVVRVVGDLATFPEYALRLRTIADRSLTIFEGGLPNEEVWRVYANTDILAVPSLWFENSPIVIQEAKAMKVPVIASNIGALPEKVGSGGILLPAGDVSAWQSAIRELANDLRSVARLRDCVEAPVSIEKHVEELQNVYRKIL